MKRKMNTQDRRLSSRDEEDLMTERSPFFMSIELKQVKQEKPDDEVENVAPTTEVQPPQPAQKDSGRSILTPRSPNVGARKTRPPAEDSPPRANTGRNVSQPADTAIRSITRPARTVREELHAIPAARTAIEMALHIFATFPLGHELYIGAERTFVKERVETMLKDLGSGYETQALWVAARLRERQVARDHIEAVIERLMDIEAKEMAQWLRSKIKDVLLLRSVCGKIVVGGEADEEPVH